MFFSLKCKRRRRSHVCVFLSKGVLPRELVSDGVLENKIPSSTIWNRCPWAGTDSRSDDSDGLILPEEDRSRNLTNCFKSRSQIHEHVKVKVSVDVKPWVHSFSGAVLAFSRPLIKADRFLLVFRVTIMSSTIWNRLQCGGNINKSSAPTCCSHKPPQDGSSKTQLTPSRNPREQKPLIKRAQFYLSGRNFSVNKLFL